MHVFDAIIPFLSKKLQNHGSAILVGSHERIPLKKDAFQLIVPNIGPALVFIDGGNGEILKAPNVSVQFVRLYATWYECNVRVERDLREFFVVVLAHQKGLDLGFEVSLFDLDGVELQKFSFDAFDPAFCFAGRRADPSTVANHVRKLLEFRFAEEICNDLHSGDVLVHDGDLEVSGEVMEQTLRLLRSTAQNKGIIVLGVSKTSTLCTDSGNSALVALRSIAPVGSWAYYSGSNVAFVKLHPGSGYVFRCDVFSHDKDRLPLAWSALAANSSDPAFLGYPYGLMEADKFAQVTKDESAQLKARFDVQSKGLFRDLASALDAHDLLNSF